MITVKNNIGNCITDEYSMPLPQLQYLHLYARRCKHQSKAHSEHSSLRMSLECYHGFMQHTRGFGILPRRLRCAWYCIVNCLARSCSHFTHVDDTWQDCPMPIVQQMPDDCLIIIHLLNLIVCRSSWAAPLHSWWQAVLELHLQWNILPHPDFSW